MANLNYTPEIQPIKKVDKRNSADEAYSKVYRESFISKAKEEAETKRLTDRANTLRWIVYSPVETKMKSIADTVKQNKINMLKNTVPKQPVFSPIKKESEEVIDTSKMSPSDKGNYILSEREKNSPIAQVLSSKEWKEWIMKMAESTSNLPLKAGAYMNSVWKMFTDRSIPFKDKVSFLIDKTQKATNPVWTIFDTLKKKANEIYKKMFWDEYSKKGEKEGDESVKKYYKNELENLLTKRNDPDNTKFEEFLYNAQDSWPQSLIWVALSMVPYVWKPAAMTYFSWLSASEQISKKWEVYSTSNMVIDTVWDMMLWRLFSRLITVPIWAVAATLEAMGTEWWTEVSQTLLKLLNDYQKAYTDEQREEIKEEFIEYVKSWDILMEFGVWAITAWWPTIVWSSIQNRMQKNERDEFIKNLVSQKDPMDTARENLTSPTTQQALDQVWLNREVAENAPIVNTAEPINPVKANVKNILQKSGKLSPVRVSDVKTDKTTRTTEKPLTEAPVASGETASKPITVYRWEGKWIWNTTLVKWEYFADSKDFAATFWKVKKSEIPAWSKIFNLDNVKEWNWEIPSEMLVDQDKLTEYLIDKWYDYTVNTNTRWTEYVKLNKAGNKLKKLARYSKSKAEFTKKVVENWNEYRDEINRLSPDQSRANMPWYKSWTEIAWDKYWKKTSKKTMPVKANVSNILKEVKKERAKKARIKKTKETKEKKSKEKKVEEVKGELTELITSENYDRLSPEWKKKALREKLNSNMNKAAEEKTWVRIEEPSKSDIKRIEKEERIMEEKPKATKTPAQIRLEYKEVVDIIEKERASEVDRMIAEDKRADLSSQYYELTWNFIEDEIWGKNDYIWESEDMDEWSIELLLEWFNEEDFTWEISERLYRKWQKELNKNEIEEFIWSNLENEKKINNILERVSNINSWEENFNLSNIVFSIADKYWVILQDQVWKSPYWKPKVISLSDRTNLVSFAHEMAHEVFYKDIYSNLWENEYKFSWPLFTEMSALVWKKMTQEETARFYDRITTSNKKIQKAAYTDIMSEAYSYMAEIAVKNISDAKELYPNMFNEFYVNKDSVFYSKRTIDIIKEINENLKIYRDISKAKQIESQITTKTNRKEAKNVWLLNHKWRLINNVRYSWKAVRELDKAYAKARWLKANNKDIFIRKNISII
jgi:hypothetical protein